MEGGLTEGGAWGGLQTVATGSRHTDDVNAVAYLDPDSCNIIVSGADDAIIYVRPSPRSSSSFPPILTNATQRKKRGGVEKAPERTMRFPPKSLQNKKKEKERRETGVNEAKQGKA